MDGVVQYVLPTIRTVADCEREFPDTIVISKYNTYDLFDELYYKIYYAICACIEIKDCLGYKIKFKFYHKPEHIPDIGFIYARKCLIQRNQPRSIGSGSCIFGNHSRK